MFKSDVIAGIYKAGGCLIRHLPLWLEKYPDKTIMGRTVRGFDFLGYHFDPKGLTLAKKAIANFIEKALRLYEQEPSHDGMRRLGEYFRRWSGWAVGSGVIYAPFSYNNRKHRSRA